MAKKTANSGKEQNADVNTDEQIGFHKGSLSTLAKEREELLKMVNVCEQLMQMHVNALKELGVDLQSQAEEMQKQGTKKPAKAKKSSKKIDELL